MDVTYSPDGEWAWVGYSHAVYPRDNDAGLIVGWSVGCLDAGRTYRDVATGFADRDMAVSYARKLVEQRRAARVS